MKPICKFVIIVSFLLSSISLFSQEIQRVSIYSRSMGKDISNIVVLPQGYSAQKSYPVLYLLHGYGDNEEAWLKIKPNLAEEISKYDMIVVCPNGEKSWYWDSPINPQSQFETYVSHELVAYIDSAFHTIHSKEGRAITGLSMGGHGGLWLGINHQDVFGACGSMSGGVDIRPFPKNWDIEKSIGKYADNAPVWDKYTVINITDRIVPDSLSIIIDCGVDDFFYEVNENLHKKLLKSNISHDYIVRPGKHNAPYWNNAIDYQLLFFAKRFAKIK